MLKKTGLTLCVLLPASAAGAQDYKIEVSGYAGWTFSDGRADQRYRVRGPELQSDHAEERRLLWSYFRCIRHRECRDRVRARPAKTVRSRLRGAAASASLPTLAQAMTSRRNVAPSKTYRGRSTGPVTCSRSGTASIENSLPGESPAPRLPGSCTKRSAAESSSFSTAADEAPGAIRAMML